MASGYVGPCGECGTGANEQCREWCSEYVREVQGRLNYARRMARYGVIVPPSKIFGAPAGAGPATEREPQGTDADINF